MEETENNLLPATRKKAFMRAYRMRVGISVALAVIALVLFAGLLLVPTHRFLSKSIEMKQEHLTSVESVLNVSNETEQKRFNEFSKDAAALMALKDAPSSVKTIETILAVPRAGITLLNFSYTPPKEEIGRSIAVSGTALTRDALRQYQLALQGVFGVSRAELPVSAYAKNVHIPFTVTVFFLP
jgi:hypothetical protein